MKHFIILFTLVFQISILQAQNPYASLGVKTEVLTLSNGKYQEFIPNDTFVLIGHVILNTVTQKIERFIDPDSIAGSYDPTASSRFLSRDPLARSYPELTPYQFASNTPIMAIDLDGLEALTVQQKQALLRERFPALQNGDVFTITKRTEFIPTGSNPKPNFDIYPGRFGSTQLQGESVIDVDGKKVTVIDQYSHFGVLWFERVTESHLSESNSFWATIFGPGIFQKGKFALKFLKTKTVIKGAIKGAKKFTRALPSSGFKAGKQRSKLIQQFNANFKSLKNNINNHLQGDDLQGAIKDIHALNPTGNHSNANHKGEVLGAIEGLKRQISFFEDALSSNKLFGEAKAAAGQAIKAGKEALNHAQEIIRLAEESAKKF